MKVQFPLEMRAILLNVLLTLEIELLGYYIDEQASKGSALVRIPVTPDP